MKYNLEYGRDGKGYRLSPNSMLKREGNAKRFLITKATNKQSEWWLHGFQITARTFVLTERYLLRM